MPISSHFHKLYLHCLMVACSLAAADKSDKAPQIPMEMQATRSTAASATPALHYRLPKNYFKFQFKLKTTTARQGRYCDVVNYFFDVKKPDCKTPEPDPVNSVELGSDVTVTELSEPDPAQAFDLQISKGLFTETNLTLGFGEGSVLTGLQSSVADHKVDFFVSLLKTAAGIAGALVRPLVPAAAPGGSHGTFAAPSLTDCSQDLDEGERAPLARLGKSHRAYACSLRADLRSGYLSVPDRYRTYIDAYLADGKAVTDHFLNALALFTEYSEIVRDERQFFLPERLPVNADAFASVANARENKLKNIRQQFLGSDEESSVDVPQIVWRFKDQPKEVELFSFDSAIKAGFCFKSADPDRWFPRALEVKACKESDNLVSVYAILYPESVAVTAPAHPAASSQAEAKGAKGSAAESATPGIAYYVAGRASLRVFARMGKDEFDYFRQSFDIAQLGTVRFLPSRIGNSTSYNITLDPLTGALKSIVVGNKPVLGSEAAQQLGDFGTSIAGLVDAVKAAQKKPTDLDNAQDEEKLKLEQYKIQLIESCKSDPTQAFCASLLKQ